MVGAGGAFSLQTSGQVCLVLAWKSRARSVLWKRGQGETQSQLEAFVGALGLNSAFYLTSVTPAAHKISPIFMWPIPCGCAFVGTLWTGQIAELSRSAAGFPVFGEVLRGEALIAGEIWESSREVRDRWPLLRLASAQGSQEDNCSPVTVLDFSHAIQHTFACFLSLFTVEILISLVSL